MDSDTSSALVVAVVGGVVAGGVGSGLLWFHDWLEKRGARKSLASALLWEIDDFYKLYIRDVSRALKDKKPEELGFDVKPLAFSRFTVYESSIDSVGLLEPTLLQGIVGWYGLARAYLYTIHDYGDAIEEMPKHFDSPVAKLMAQNRAVSLLRQIKGAADSFLPISRTVCEGLADVARASYTFDIP